MIYRAAWCGNFFGCMLPPTPLAGSVIISCFGELAFGELGTDSLVLEYDSLVPAPAN